jgi:hypothetical protein
MRKLLLATTLLAFPALAYAQAIGSLSTLPQFTVNVTGFTAPNGQPWNAHGLNVDLGDALQNLKGIVQNYPGMSMARVVANGNTDTLANIDPIVQAYTSKGIVVELEDHADSQNGNNTGWYSMLANAYKNNPYVFLETPNEPSDPNTAQNQINIIKAIRATGFNNPIQRVEPFCRNLCGRHKESVRDAAHLWKPMAAVRHRWRESCRSLSSYR